MARSFRASLLCGIVLASCQGVGPSSPPASVQQSPGLPTGATMVPATESPPPLATPAPSCPKGPLSVRQFLLADGRCFITEEIEVVGWWGPRNWDYPFASTNLWRVLRSRIPLSQSAHTTEFLFVDNDAALEPWAGGIHWASVTGRRSATNDRACHYDGVGDGIPAQHCPSYLVASRVAASEPPDTALAECSRIPTDKAGWVDVYDFTDYPPACFGSRSVTVRGWLDVGYTVTGLGEGLGEGDGGPRVEPAWLWLPAGPWTVVAPSLNPETPAALVVYVDPASGPDLSRTNRWVLLTGHYFDKQADTCRVVYRGDPMTDPLVPDGFARQSCELNFVATGVRDTSP